MQQSNSIFPHWHFQIPMSVSISATLFHSPVIAFIPPSKILNFQNFDFSSNSHIEEQRLLSVTTDIFPSPKSFLLQVCVFVLLFVLKKKLHVMTRTISIKSFIKILQIFYSGSKTGVCGGNKPNSGRGRFPKGQVEVSVQLGKISKRLGSGFHMVRYLVSKRLGCTTSKNREPEDLSPPVKIILPFLFL